MVRETKWERGRDWEREKENGSDSDSDSESGGRYAGRQKDRERLWKKTEGKDKRRREG